MLCGDPECSMISWYRPRCQIAPCRQTGPFISYLESWLFLRRESLHPHYRLDTPRAQGACLNAAVMKLVEALVRLQPSSSNESEGKYAPAEAAAAAAATPYEKGGVQFPVRRPPAGCDLGASTKVVGVPIPSSTKRGKQRHSAGEAEDEDAPKNKEGDENRKQKEKARGEAEGCGGQEQQRQLSEEASAEGTTCAQGEGRQDDRSWGRTSSPPPIQAAGRALTSKPHVEFWDKLR